jgi:hypothetical protein
MQKVSCWLLGLGLIIFSAGCKKDVRNPEEDGAHGVITTFAIKFSQAGVVKYEAIFDDPDGPGGNAPVRFDDILLNAGQTYQASITLTNKTKTPNEDLTTVIRSAGHQHQFFFVPTGISGLSISITDRDRLGLPIGLESNWQTPASPQTGTLRVNLRHLAVGKSENSTVSSGHSDIMIDFATSFQ